MSIIRIHHFLLLAFISLIITACSQQSDFKTINTNSNKISNTADKIKLLEQYVTFKRTYKALDFYINIHNNSSGIIAAPSDWDIGIIAVIPHHEIKLWLSETTPFTEKINKQWLKNIPTNISSLNIQEWYQQAPNIVIGIDRKNNILAYRNFTN